MKYYSLEIEEILKKLRSKKTGLSTKEANERLEKYGKNIILESKKKSIFIKFLTKFKDPMIIVLILASAFSFASSYLNKESYLDSIIIIVIVILNAVLALVQEIKSDNSIDKLKNMQISKVKVRRDNKIYIINSEDIVVGDILVLESGDKVPADSRIIYEVSLKVDESSLTGESDTISKSDCILAENTPFSQRKNMIYSGTYITYGKCEAIACETGMNTEFGLIAESLGKDTNKTTPLQKRVESITKFLTFAIAIIIFIVFFIGIFKKMDTIEIIMLSISLEVAAIPEGLPAVITIILSLGASELAQKKAIVKNISSVETLGTTEIICSDKTGTITKNEMVVKKIYFNDEIVDSSEFKSNNILFNIIALNNDVYKNKDKYIGDSTEIATYKLCESIENIEAFKENNPRISELPFDSDRKMMSTINENSNGIRIYTKGSFDSIINNCSFYYSNGRIKKLTDKAKEKIKEIENEFSSMSYRVLAYAYKNISNTKKSKNLENNLIFAGLVAMSDPPRDDVKDAIKECINADMRPIMITGDGLSTAISIAKEIGILNKKEEAVSGIEIDQMTESELQRKVNNYSVYARVSPINKLSIVNAFKQNGKIVAMTGDGVNDAPALKKADIGIGMGITGTEVSKSAADIILADDSFSTIVSAIKEGRRIFDNIRNSIVYLLVGNITEIIVIFIGILFGKEIFLPIQLLYINLITDSIPAISLAFEKAEKDVMKKKSKKYNDGFFTPFIISKILVSSLLKSIAILALYFVNLKLYGHHVASTLAFLTLVLFELIFTYSCKNIKKTILNKNIFNNKVLNIGIILLIILQTTVFITPIKSIFNITDINLFQFGYTLLIVLSAFMIDELLKKVIARHFRD